MPTSPLLDWVRNPDSTRGIHFGLPDQAWSYWSYARLAEHSSAAANGLARAGIREGDVVTIVGRSGPDFVASFFGTLALGATPSPMAPPMAFQDPEVYRGHLVNGLAAAGSALIIADSDLAPVMRELPAGGPDILSVGDLLFLGDSVSARDWRRRPGSIALVQFTSGSTGHARAVRISNAAIEANIAAIRRWLRWTPEDSFAAWLPLNHDMGLIGALLSAIVSRSDLWLLPPEEFIRDPLRYLRCLGALGARLSVTPCFGLAYILRRLSPDALDGLDFSGVRGMVIGAERVDARILDEFGRLLAPHGLRRQALLPAYGLAEATLAVSGVPLDEEWTSATLDPASLALSGRVAPSLDADGRDGTVVVGCGRPLAGVEISIIREDGEPLPEGHVGEIQVRGESLADSYAGDSDSTHTKILDGALRTGDAGFLLEGQLYILGRLGDSMKVRGRLVFSEDLEVAVAAAGAPSQRIAVLLGMHEGNYTAVLLAEEASPRWREAAEGLLRERTDGADVVFASVPRGTIVRTSSGKPRRRQMWNAFAAGSLPVAPRGGHG